MQTQEWSTSCQFLDFGGTNWAVCEPFQPDVISKTFMRISMEDLKVLLAWVFTNFPEFEYFGDPFLL
jgi:hypothetical protein